MIMKNFPRSSVFVLALAFMGPACGPSPDHDDGGQSAEKYDSAVPDSGSKDAAAKPDASPDAAMKDSGAVDGGGIFDGAMDQPDGAAPVAVHWCVLQWPPSVTLAAGESSENIYGRIYQAGVSEAWSDPSAIIARVGSAPLGGGDEADWNWHSATFLQHVANDQDELTNAEFGGQLKFAAAGDYIYAFSFSVDGGSSWTLCDLGGSQDGFQPSEAGQAHVFLADGDGGIAALDGAVEDAGEISADMDSGFGDGPSGEDGGQGDGGTPWWAEVEFGGCKILGPASPYNMSKLNIPSISQSVPIDLRFFYQNDNFNDDSMYEVEWGMGATGSDRATWQWRATNPTLPNYSFFNNQAFKPSLPQFENHHFYRYLLMPQEKWQVAEEYSYAFRLRLSTGEFVEDQWHYCDEDALEKDFSIDAAGNFRIVNLPEVDWCVLQWPYEHSHISNPIYVRAYIEGITGEGGSGPPPIMQIGVSGFTQPDDIEHDGDLYYFGSGDFNLHLDNGPGEFTNDEMVMDLVDVFGDSEPMANHHRHYLGRVASGWGAPWRYCQSRGCGRPNRVGFNYLQQIFQI